MRRFSALLFAVLSGGFLLVFMAGSAEAQAVSYTDLYDFNCGGLPATAPCYPNAPGILAQGTDGNFYGMACDTLAFCGNGYIFTTTSSGALTVLQSFTGTTSGSPGLTLAPDGNFYGVTSFGGTSNLGTIFKITPTGVLTTLHSFNGKDGFSPASPPVLGDDGYLYGTAVNFGYKVSTSGKFSVLTDLIPYEQATPTMGSVAPLLLASDGTFYGTIPQGNRNGASPGGTVFRMSPGGAVTVIYNFEPDDTGTNFPQGNFPYGGLAQGADGNLYGTTGYGGAGCSICGVVFQLTRGGSLGWEYSFTGLNDGYLPQAGLVAANDGSFYGATTFTGCDVGDCNGTIFSVNDSGSFNLVYLLTADCSAGSCYGGEPVATPMQATDGKIYGTTSQGGFWNQGVFYALDIGAVKMVSTIQPSGKSGQTVGILGQGFTSTSRVAFNGVAAKIVTVSDTYLTTKVPAKATSGQITVTTSGLTLTSNRNFRVLTTTITAVTTSGSPSQAGQPVTFTSTITPKAGTIPDGELVTFFDGAKKIGTGTTLGGAATFTTSALKAKTHTIKASYEGDGSFLTSSGKVTQAVTP